MCDNSVLVTLLDAEDLTVNKKDPISCLSLVRKTKFLSTCSLSPVRKTNVPVLV